MTTCPNCHREVDQIKSVIVRNAIQTGCDACIHTLTQGNDLAAQNHRVYDRREHRRSIVQPLEHAEYLQAYGADKAREEGFSEEMIRKYGH